MVNGAHDLGGMHGFGPVAHQENEPVFHEEWEGRVFGLRVATEPLGLFDTTDQLRFAIESLPPGRYLSASYYELRLIAIEQELLARGLITRDELDQRTSHYEQNPSAPPPRREDPELKERVVAKIHSFPPKSEQPVAPPRFQVGDRVRARNVHPHGHTRLPRYVRGKVGIVERVHAAHGLPDLTAERRPAEPMAVYGVRFTARELWGDAADPKSTLAMDLWESYLEPA
jgi:nitrile hydratase subunit beta